jgi:RNA polymerase sigma factor (sigma-70 family)
VTDHAPRAPSGRGRFETTRWSVVLDARSSSGDASSEALQWLCQTYWFPLYTYVRRWGHTPEDAQDLTQEFFTRLLEKRYLEQVNPDRGRFRSFLLASMKHFLSNERDRVNAAKRGGGRAPLPLELETAEGLYRREPPDHFTPDKAFERQWARTILDRTMGTLRAEHEAAGRAAWFDRMKDVLTGDATSAYATIAKELGMTEGALKVAVHRLRRRYGELLREEIGTTLADPADVDDEIRYLFAALAP